MELEFAELTDLVWEEWRAKSPRFEYLKSYVSQFYEGGQLTIITEHDYIDKDFLIDYSLYYSRCFEEVAKKVDRVHFFKSDLAYVKALFDEYFDDPIIKSAVITPQLSDIYIGFTTIKPISSHRGMGRSLLKHYPSTDREGNQRHFSVYDKFEVNIAGIKLPIESVPFQEQDRNVAACATTAIWASLRPLHRIFDCARYYSQYEITNIAYEMSRSNTGRMFPNEGLFIQQILGLVSKIGYDPVFYALKNRDNHFIDNLLISHLKIGIPVLAILALGYVLGKDENGADVYHSEGHLVTIVGFKTISDNLTLNELYVHDDQIGAYSRVKLEQDDHSMWINEWIGRKLDNDIEICHVYLDSIIVPLYHKIRISYTSIYTYLKNYIGNSKAQHSIRLHTVKSFKEYIIEYRNLIDDITFVQDDKKISYRELLSMSLPKYCWLACLVSDISVAHVLFDATSYQVTPFVKIAHQL